MNEVNCPIARGKNRLDPQTSQKQAYYNYEDVVIITNFSGHCKGVVKR